MVTAVAAPPTAWLKTAEEFQRWQDYIISHNKKNEPILLPKYFDVYEFEEGEEVEYEES